MNHHSLKGGYLLCLAEARQETKAASAKKGVLFKAQHSPVRTVLLLTFYYKYLFYSEAFPGSFQEFSTS